MMKRFLVAVFTVCMMTLPGVAKEIGGVSMPDTLAAGKSTLVLNGAGIRKKDFLDIYAGGLYLKENCRDPKKIIEADEPMAIRLHIVSGLVSGEDMARATEESFVASTGGNTTPIQDNNDQFIAVFKEGIAENDVYDLIYLPGTGVQVYKNNKLVKTIPSLNFKKALFGVWLCEKPTINIALKKGLLGVNGD